jgi:DNA repair protein SbcD/Mre11
MPRLLHMADVHLGARHHDLGPAAATQRERQLAAFRRALELAVSENVDLVLICGDLFDSNAQPRRSVELAAAELRRLVERNIPTVIIPGTHDCYDSSSIYRAFDLPALAGVKPDSSALVILTDTNPKVTYADLDLTVHGFVARTKQMAASPLAGFNARSAEDRTSRWQVGMIHGSLAVPGKVEQDDVLFTADEVAASGLDYLALGHWHSFREGRAAETVWAYPGAPEPVALDQDGAGRVLIVELGATGVKVEPRLVGRSRVARLELDAAAISSQPELVAQLRAQADPDVVADVRLVGIRSEELDLHLDEVEHELAEAFLRLRLRDESVASLPTGPLPPADTIAGAFSRDLQARIEQAEQAGDGTTAADLREALHIGRLLLDDPARVTLA